jgi:hypothetical protein
MSDQKVPQAPDYSPMINAFNSIAASASQHGTDALNWAKDQVANNKGLVDQVNKGLLDTQGTFSQAGKDALAQSQKNTTDATDYIRAQRDKYTDPTRIQSDMGAAEAGVAQSFDAARAAHTQELEGYGLNPADTRLQALDLSTRVQQAAAAAGAGNTAARTDEQLATGANTQLLGQGNVQAGQAVADTGVGNTAGTAAVGNAINNTASGNQSLGTGLQWTGAQTGAVGGAVSGQNTGFQNTAESDKIANSTSSGLGTLLGAGLGAMGKGGALASGGALAFLAEGGAVPDGPVGGEVPVTASPSRGAITDDVRATGPGGAIRLNGGEFVIPKDVVSWEGEKSLQNLIAKARKAKQGATAKPAVGGPDPAAPQFQQRAAVG